MTTTPTTPTTTKKMRWWVVLLIMFGVMALIGVIIIGGIVWWFSANKDRLMAEGKAAEEEAQVYARDHEQSACVDEGLRKADACGGIMCEAMAKVFTDRCIQRAQPTAGFCDGVPPPNEIMKTSHWVVDECQRRGKASDQRCQRLMQAVPMSCQSKAPSSPPPPG